jgi:hypothetical protein
MDMQFPRAPFPLWGGGGELGVDFVVDLAPVEAVEGAVGVHFFDRGPDHFEGVQVVLLLLRGQLGEGGCRRSSSEGEATEDHQEWSRRRSVTGRRGGSGSDGPHHGGRHALEKSDEFLPWFLVAGSVVGQPKEAPVTGRADAGHGEELRGGELRQAAGQRERWKQGNLDLTALAFTPARQREFRGLDACS